LNYQVKIIQSTPSINHTNWESCIIEISRSRQTYSTFQRRTHFFLFVIINTTHQQK
jgi:hypothetical protein